MGIRELEFKQIFMSQKIEFFPYDMAGLKVTTWHFLRPFSLSRHLPRQRDNKKPIPYWAIDMAMCLLPCCIDRLRCCHVLVAQFNVPSILEQPPAAPPLLLTTVWCLSQPGPQAGCKKYKKEPDQRDDSSKKPSVPLCHLKCHQENWKNSSDMCM